MALSPTEIVGAILDNPTDLDHVRSLVTDEVIYVSLNYDNPDLKRIMPWCGTSKGPESIVKTFVDVGRYWEKHAVARHHIEPENVLCRYGANTMDHLKGLFTNPQHVASRLNEMKQQQLQTSKRLWVPGTFPHYSNRQI
jgi:hypothetical protein